MSKCDKFWASHLLRSKQHEVIPVRDDELQVLVGRAANKTVSQLYLGVGSQGKLRTFSKKQRPFDGI